MQTPMMAQYAAIKKDHPDALVFFRLGDFYELFCDDAITASKVLHIALTKRGQSSDGNDIPMCGVPAHSYEVHLKKLIEAGFKVAICEQMEEPQKGRPVRREVVRVITKGTLTEGDMLEERFANFLLVLSKPKKDLLGIASCDVSTGFLRCETLALKDLNQALCRYASKEILLPASLHKELAFRKEFTPYPDSRFNADNVAMILKTHFGELKSYGVTDELEIQALGVLFDYLNLTQKNVACHIKKIERFDIKNHLIIDETTRRNLELTQTMSGQYEGSIAEKLNQTKTAGGSRLFLSRLNEPFIDINKINAQLDRVQNFIDKRALCEQIRDGLKNFPDLERALSRIALKRGSPRDLGLIRKALLSIIEIGRLIKLENDALCKDLYERLHSALIDEMLPISLSEGGFIRQGYSLELDELRLLSTDGKDIVGELETKYRKETGVASLKLKFNSVWGYFIEVPAARMFDVPLHFVHKQTLSTCKRFTTKELYAAEDTIKSAQSKAISLEKMIFEDLREAILEPLDALQRQAHLMARLDLTTTFAFLAYTYQYARPEMMQSPVLEIIEGRHVVLDDPEFVPNDLNLDSDVRFVLLTGPNMGGKSTYLRQNALIILLAHMGCFVPAKSARIGIVDRIMSRVGASDDISQKQSTFMVEMVETASIVHQATQRSFVILDEVGRGTSTYDGLSIAWAVCEHLLEQNRCKVIFATHYQELGQLKHQALVYKNVAIKEWDGKVIFLHKIEDGVAEKSYGIHVAALAGLPESITTRAFEKLKSLTAA